MNFMNTSFQVLEQLMLALKKILSIKKQLLSKNQQ